MCVYVELRMIRVPIGPYEYIGETTDSVSMSTSAWSVRKLGLRSKLIQKYAQKSDFEHNFNSTITIIKTKLRTAILFLT